MNKLRKLFLSFAILIFSACMVWGGLMLSAEAASVPAKSDWTPLAGWRDSTAVVDYKAQDGTQGVNIYQSGGTDFSVSYTKNPFYLDGFTFKFYADFSRGTRGNSNLKIVMTQSGNVWWNEDKAAFSIDFKYETPDSCTVTMNTKNPNGYSDKATSPGNVNPTFYWDNSRENVFKLYFKDDGLLYVNINDTELNCGKDGLDTGRLREWGILDRFTNGRAYLQLWGQQLSATLRLDVREQPSQMAEPVFTDFSSNGEWTVNKGSVQSLLDGVRLRAFKADASGFTVTSSEKISLKNTTVGTNLALAENGKVGFFYNGLNDAQVRVYLCNAQSDNLIIAKYSSGTEDTLYTGTHSFALMDMENPDYSKKITLQMKRVGKTYKFLLDDEFIDCDLSALTSFISQNFGNEACTLSIYMQKEGIVKTAGQAAASEDSSFAAKFVNATGSAATIAADGTYEMIYSETNDGAFKVCDKSSKLWPDSFGIRFRLDKLTPGDDTEFRLILSSKSNWYTDAEARAIIIGFSKDGAKTKVVLSVYSNTQETKIAEGNTSDFSWNYATENFVNFGYTNYGWILIVGDNEVSLSGNDDDALTQLMETFEEDTAYLQLENKGGANTVVSVCKYGYMVESFIAPRGWQQGHYLVAPQWGEASPSVEAVFGYPGESYTVEKQTKVPFDGFKIELSLAPGKSFTQISMALSDGSTDWYNTCWSIGVMFTYDPDSEMLKNGEIEFGLLYGNPDENLESYRVTNLTASFNWYGKNTIEIKSYRGKYILTLNGEEYFENFDSLVTKLAAAYEAKNNNAELQFFVQGDTTVRIYDVAEIETVEPPTVQRLEADKYNNAEYKLGEEISIDLSSLFKSQSGNALTYKANIGEIEGSIWKYTPDQAGDLNVTFTAQDGDAVSLPLTITLKISGGNKKSGCGSSLTVPAFLSASLALLATAGLIFSRRKKDEV